MPLRRMNAITTSMPSAERMNPETQEAILCHELIHVRRKDWTFTVLEEVILAALWFHPAAWWLVSQIRLAREQMVDLEVILITGHGTIQSAVLAMQQGAFNYLLKPLELPHSKILVYFATGYHDWNEGCGVADLARCFWLNLAFDVPAGSLAPDKAIAWKFADYRDGVDTVMKEVAAQAAALVRERR